jgi:hypothetical protein
MRSYYLIFLLVLLLLFVGCKDEELYNHKIEEEKLNFTIEVYNSIDNANTSDNKRLLFTEQDIESYDWEEQRIYFNDNIIIPDSLSDVLKKPYIGSEIFNTGNFDKFLIYINEELIYEGYYSQSPASSFGAMGITMCDEYDGISIVFGGIVGSEDFRFDQRIHEALESNELLKE